MAWNEPGNNGGRDKDPWGNNDQGPPDLAEALEKLKKQLSGIFSGGGGQSGGDAGGTISSMLLLLIAAALLLVWDRQSAARSREIASTALPYRGG